MTAPASYRVARNGTLYFGSLAIPAIAAIFLVPVTVRALGASRFGLLALAWALAEGAGMFDFGLARTTVRFVADASVRGRDRVREIVVVSVISQAIAGLVAGALLIVLAPVLVTRVFTVSPNVIPEAIAMFRVLAFHVPVLLSLSALRASLEGAQRFEISTALRVPGSLASVIIPAIAAPAGASLPAILWLLLIARATLLVISAVAVRLTLLRGAWTLPHGFRTLREMLGYSGWVAVSAALGPALGSIDRFVVGSVVGVAGLGYYTGAAEAANRFFVIPSTAFSALLPALANTEARGARDRSLAATRAATRQLATLMLPLCLALFAFAPAILKIWLGPVFSAQAGTALRVFAIGIFLGALAHLPLAALYGANRPDLPAKFHIAEVIVHVPLTFFLVRTFGITGAALAWTLRCGADYFYYDIAMRRFIGRHHPDVAERQRTLRLLWLSLALAVALVVVLQASSFMLSFAIILLAVSVLGYGFVGWFKVLSDEERQAWLMMIARARVRSR